jgi:hypothetical protein
MLNAASDPPEDPALLKAMIAQLQAENAKLTTTLRAHDLVVQALRLQIARLRKQAASVPAPESRRACRTSPRTRPRQHLPGLRGRPASPRRSGPFPPVSNASGAEHRRGPRHCRIY